MNRIKNLREEFGMTQQELADKLNGAKSTIAMYEKGDRKPSLEVLMKLSEIFNCTIDYLMGLTNIRNTITDMKVDGLSDDEKKHVYNVYENMKKQYYMCPVYGRISAGIPNWVEECIEGRLPIDPELFGIINPEEHFFLRVNGESMNQLIRNGAYALIHKQDIVEDGEIAVVLVNGDEATLKKFSKQGDFVVLEPMSNDESFKTQIYDKNTPIKILGKYVGKFEMK